MLSDRVDEDEDGRMRRISAPDEDENVEIDGGRGPNTQPETLQCRAFRKPAGG